MEYIATGEVVVCKTCDDHYLVDTGSGLCVPGSLEGCKRYTLGICTECDVGRSLKPDNSCSAPSIDNCAVDASDCDKCHSGFALATIKGYCQSQQDIHSLYDLDGNLVDCFGNDFSIVGGLCTETKANCVEGSFNVTVFECTKCKKGYYLFNKNCIKNLAETQVECTTAGGDNTCLQCNPGFYTKRLPITHYCVPETTFCVKYNTNRVCVLCQNGYFVNAQDNCEQVSSTTPIANCETYHYDKCLKCATGFMRTVEGDSCVATTHNCLIYKVESDQTFCLSCVDTYARVVYDENATASVFMGYDETTLEAKTAKIPLAQCQQGVDCYTNVGTVLEDCESAKNVVSLDGGGNEVQRYCCQKCKGTMTGNNLYDQSDNIFVDKCSPIALCDTAFRFKPIGKLAATVTDLNCNKCQDVNGQKTLLVYSIASTVPKERCDFMMIENCQVAKEDKERNLECLICDPGYKLDAKKRCVTFNCKETTVPNSCEFCEDGFILSIDAKNCLASTSNLFFGKDIDVNCKKADTDDDALPCRNVTPAVAPWGSKLPDGPPSSSAAGVDTAPGALV